MHTPVEVAELALTLKHGCSSNPARDSENCSIFMCNNELNWFLCTAQVLKVRWTTMQGRSGSTRCVFPPCVSSSHRPAKHVHFTLSIALSSFAVGLSAVAVTQRASRFVVCLLRRCVGRGFLFARLPTSTPPRTHPHRG